MQWAKRLLDVCAAALGLALLWPLLVLLALWVRADSPGPALYWSQRVGAKGRLFLMPKFRSMRVDTPTLATHLLSQPENYLTRSGRWLRRSSLDELPQLWSVLIGDMSLVGPRPALFNQTDLIAARAAHGVDRLRPGITGWAQINGRDELPIPRKVAFDAAYLEHCSLLFDLKILVLTVLRVVRAEGVKH